ncbi:HK97 family phage prohead protease [Canibacter zhoujuaniae]|uniref:HK97 family phage prohead protease n=1 Tax=Canibacter zhoujuaniae TaxID=2708343 RepID=UPI00141DF6E1|nr:HK97 family phage prohead protease [Canibacter zhoujuaniae]
MSNKKQPKAVALAAAAPKVEFEKREITGIILEYGTVGTPSSGTTIFNEGTLRTPNDLSRVKLLSDHNRNLAAIGYMTAIETDGPKVLATFRVPESEAGDRALIEARDGLRDGLSVGVTIIDYEYDEDSTTLKVLEAELHEVSLVTIPAFENARVTSLASNSTHYEQEETLMTTITAAAPAITPPAAPAALPADFSLASVAGQFAQMYSDGKTVDSIASTLNRRIEAALTKQVPEQDSAKVIFRPQFVDELWRARRTERRFFDAHPEAKRALTSLSVEGWRYKHEELPEVSEYNGNATAITSKGKIETERVVKDAKRRAGGWTVDRAFVDLGSRDFIESVFTAGMESYLKQTEAALVKELLAEATAIEAGTNFAETLAKLGTQAGALGSRLDVVDMSADLWLKFAALKSDEVPWFLRNQGELNLNNTTGKAGNISFAVNPDLPAGTILAADSRAYTPYELPDMVRVEAVNIGNGAIDLGLYGYTAQIVNDPRAVFKITAPGLDG